MYIHIFQGLKKKPSKSKTLLFLAILGKGMQLYLSFCRMGLVPFGDKVDLHLPLAPKEDSPIALHTVPQVSRPVT